MVHRYWKEKRLGISQVVNESCHPTSMRQVGTKSLPVRPRPLLKCVHASFSLARRRMTLNHKADRSTKKAEELVNTTLDHLRTIREESEAESTTATYAREEVNGPLKGVGKEEVVIEQEETTISEDGTNRAVKETHTKFLGMTSSEENVNHAQSMVCCGC